MAVGTTFYIKIYEEYMGKFKMYYVIEDNKLIPAKEKGMDITTALETLKKAQTNGHNDGVHVTHCCVAHGCKYGDRDCPVETGRIQQEYLCEECGYNGIENLDDLRTYVMRSMNDKEPLISEENFVKLYGMKPCTDLTEKVPVSLELLQRVWVELFNNPPEENMVEYQNTIDEIIELLDKWNALPDIKD